jgi:hypothetical protein
MPRNYISPSPKNPTSRVDGGIGSSNGKQNVNPVYQMMTPMAVPMKPTSNRGRKPDLPPPAPVYPTPEKLKR